MAVTLNKDGKPRKVGSGKTKGAGCITNIKWQQLKEFISENEDIQVSRVWLRSIGALSQKRGNRKKVSQKTLSKVRPPEKLTTIYPRRLLSRQQETLLTIKKRMTTNHLHCSVPVAKLEIIKKVKMVVE